jgi:hypothetical protein
VDQAPRMGGIELGFQRLAQRCARCCVGFTLCARDPLGVRNVLCSALCDVVQQSCTRRLCTSQLLRYQLCLDVDFLQQCTLCQER